MLCVFFSAGILNGTLSTNLQPPQPSHASSCSPFAPLAAPFTAYHLTELARRQEGRRQGGRGESGKARRGSWWRNLGEESVLVAPTEKAVGLWAELFLYFFSEGLQLESVQDPLSWNSRRWELARSDEELPVELSVCKGLRVCLGACWLWAVCTCVKVVQ